ncbi:MAG: hypothetical protein JSW43_11585 [Gemmatimonadota bacterium]|nr:MAG: hypothetical protein JSW43_11585 [Gemmatimonadota bacterium]
MAVSPIQRNEELPCIWVQAGVLSYRLCDRNYDCEQCELFHALRGHGSGAVAANEYLPADEATELEPSQVAVEDQVNAYVSRLIADCELHLDRPYTAGHFWLRDAGPDGVTAGLDGHVMRVLHPLDDVVAPRAGALLKRGEPCGWVVRGRMTIPLETPISGEVASVNQRYVEQLRAGSVSGAGDEWLLRISPHESLDAVPNVYHGDRTLVWFLRKIRLVKRSLREVVAVDGQAALGPTLADGGEANLNVEQVLGRERFEALVDQLFHMHI